MSGWHSEWVRPRWWRVRQRTRGRALLILRRAVAVALLSAAVVVALRPGVSVGEARVPVLTSASDLAPGTTLRGEHVRIVEVPRSMRPSGAFADPAAVTGRMLAGPARAGEPITDVRVVGPRGELVGTTGPDTATVPIRLADAAVVDFLHPGASVDVVAPRGDEQQRQVLAELATVVTVVKEPQAVAADFGRKSNGPLVLIAVPVEAAKRVAGVSLAGALAVTLR